MRTKGGGGGGGGLSVLKAWVGLFLVKIDMLNCWLNFSNTQQCIDTIYTRLKNIKNVKRCRDGMPESMQTR